MNKNKYGWKNLKWYEKIFYVYGILITIASPYLWLVLLIMIIIKKEKSFPKLFYYVGIISLLAFIILCPFILTL